jgi:hypothetical protein
MYLKKAWKRMTDEDIKAVVEEGRLPLEVAISYLNIYVGVADWPRHIAQVHSAISKKERDPGPKMRQVISCAILLPAADKSTYIDSEHPENLLLKMPWYHQLSQRDWFELLQKTIKHDQEIKKWRMKAWSLGVIDPLEFVPNTRQAFNWLYMKAEETGDITPETKEEITKRFRNLVHAYGGAVICGIFTRHEDVLKKIVNWRSGYFFERAIFDVYTDEQVMKIKKRELESASEKLVKKIRVREH